MNDSDAQIRLTSRAAKAWLNREALPWAALDRFKQTLMKQRHHRLARIGAGTTIYNEGWIENPQGNPDRIRIGERCAIRGHLFVFPHGGQISIGDGSFIGGETRIWSSKNLSIGRNVLISHQVNIMDTNGHSLDPRLRESQFESIRTSGHPSDAPDIQAAPIEIADHAWIGHSATILKGVVIGEGAVVAAGAMVTESVSEYTVVAGFPAIAVRDISNLRYPAP